VTAPAAPRSCASCGIADCAMNRRHGVAEPPTARASYILDDVWPEYASLVASAIRPDDQVIAPGLLGSPLPARYGWPGTVRHIATFATLRRHLAMRRVVDSPGGVRQRSALHHDRMVARRLAQAIDYRAGHLVVSQSWLLWLDEAGALGGRSFDVLMTRYPMADIHLMLDRIAVENGRSPTIADFRAEAALVERERELLARARHIVTPHHGIAALHPRQAVRLAWHRPEPLVRIAGDRVAFMGPTITRQRPDIARSLAASLDRPLIVFGQMLAGPDFWDGVQIEPRAMGPGWLDGIATILHPAAFTNQPRSLLQAIANGVTIRATNSCGLDPVDFTIIADPVHECEHNHNG
jgi:hypothetical protein